MQSFAAPSPSSTENNGSTWSILSYVYFTFVAYLSVGLPLAILPAYVHFSMGYSAALAGFVISVQYIATFVSRPWAGRISDRAGAKVSVLWGMAGCTVSGALLLAAAMLSRTPWLSIAILILSRLVLGASESQASTGSTLWGISNAGQKYTAKVISFNGVANYGALALGAPLGVVLEQQWGLASIGLVTILIGALSLVLASIKRPIMAPPGKNLPFRDVLGRIAPYGMGLAMSGVGYSVLATFVTLFYISRHWNGAALCLTAFGLAFVAARALIRTINRFGGFAVGLASFLVEFFGVLLLWRANSPWTAFTGAIFTGLGYSLVFPALGVEALKRVTENNRGSALGIFTAFADVSFFMVGPLAGIVIGSFGYASAFLFALLCILTAMVIVVVLMRMRRKEARHCG
jgi:predicted MFS family arabinose efflux permease